MEPTSYCRIPNLTFRRTVVGPVEASNVTTYGPGANVETGSGNSKPAARLSGAKAVGGMVCVEWDTIAPVLSEMRMAITTGRIDARVP
jgi:hypothetical protein